MINNRKLNHKNIYLLGLIFLAIGLPLSKFLMSFAEIILFANWILEGNIFNKIKIFFKNKLALILSSLFLLHILGLLYTSDFDYAFKDLRVKLPLLILPLIVSTSPQLDRKKIITILLLFVLAVLASTFASTYFFINADFNDIRNISVYISHIRLSLLICMSIFILLYFVIYGSDFSKRYKIFFSFTIIWFIAFLIILESITGLAILIIIGLILLITEVFRQKKNILKIELLVLIIAIPSLIFYYINGIYHDFFKPPTKQKLEKVTKLGNKYFNDSLNTEIENGHYVWINICEKEMKESWNKLSNLNYDGKDKRDQYLKSTLLRFLTSKGYKKDAEGVNKLTKEEIICIENGIANVYCKNDFSVKSRIFETIWEYENYRKTSNPNGHSVMQRFEYWKASLGIIKENLFLGVGTGDMNEAFANQYNKTNSPLEKKWRLRSHNQFLSITVGFGLIGLLWFMVFLIFPFFHKKVKIDYFYIIFFLIAILSMLAEDTIESQAGITFFVFFNTLLLLGRKNENNLIS